MAGDGTLGSNEILVVTLGFACINEAFDNKKINVPVLVNCALNLIPIAILAFMDFHISLKLNIIY